MTKSKPFTHLHVHSEYSLLRASCRIEEIAKRTAELGMHGAALTDGGNLFAALPFVAAMKKAGVQPILGLQANVARGGRGDRGREAKRTHDLVLLATDLDGWESLRELATIGYLEGYYYVPRVDREVLARHARGLIALSGGLRGEVGEHLAHDDDARARATAGELAEIYGRDRFFLELQDHGLPQETKVNETSVALAAALGLGTVVTNNVHYALREDAIVHDVLLCIGQGKQRSDEKRPKLYGDQYYFKSPAEMWELFGHWPAALEATEEIRARCKVELALGGMHIPVFATPDGLSPAAYLRQLCVAGIRTRYGDAAESPRVQERLALELGVIERMGFISYFLIVQDFIAHARSIGVPVGPGRGSAAGSIVAYALGITGIDPLRYDLLFERFLNEGRMEMPDIDIDFETEGRARVIEYVTQRYGRDNVAQIITFGSMAARGSLRDVARVLDYPLAAVDTLAKKVPMTMSLDEAVASEPELATAIKDDPATKELFDIARRIEGLARQAGTHAAGVIIADAPIRRYCPLFKSGDEIATQFDMRTIEQVGLLKMDFLGLSTLTLLERARDLVRVGHGLELDLDHIPLDDARTYRLLSRAESRGVFQFESEGMRKLLARMQPDRFEDLIAVVALFRPGPLGSGMIDSYVDVKHGRAEPSYLDKALEPILAETYGVILYQEQVMRIASDLAGFSLQEADRLRKAMGKKKKEIMDDYAQRFTEGARARGFDPAIARQIFDTMAHFAGYGFNKSHSAAYAFIAYQTAWLKANYPREFMAALLTVESQNTDKIVTYVEESRRMGITILPPDVNRSASHFTVEATSAQPAIRFGLLAIKGAGDKAMAGIVGERGARPYASLHELCERVDLHTLNRSVLEALVKAGACDSLGGHRAALMAGIERALAAAQSVQKDRRQGQGALFGGPSAARTPTGELPATPPWPDRERLAKEKEALGFYLTGHPLAEHARRLAEYTSTTLSMAAELPDGTAVLVGGLISGFTTRLITREGRNQGKRMARFVLEDLERGMGCVVFPGILDKFAGVLVEDAVVIVRAKVANRGGDVELLIDEVLTLNDARRTLTASVVLALDDAHSTSSETTTALAELVRRHPGPTQVLVEVTSERGTRVTIRADEELRVTVSDDFVAAVERLLGPGTLICSVR